MMKQQSIFQKTIKYIFILTLIFTACKKERVEQDDFQPMDSFYNKYRQQEQEFVVDTGQGSCLLVGKMGTRIYNICDTGAFRRKKDNTSITYPYKVKLVEIYPVADMIYWPLPSIGGGKILETAASIRVWALKDNDTLVLRAGRSYTATLDTMPTLFAGPQVYGGVDNSTYIDWILDPNSSAIVQLYNDSMTIGNMGWVNCARLNSSTATNTPITFTVAGNNPQNIGIFLVFKNFKSVMQVYNLTSGQVPVGETVTLIAMALNQNGQYFLDKRDITVSAGLNISLNMQAISEGNLVTTINGL